MYIYIIYICIFIYIYIYIHTYIYIYTHTHKYICIYKYICICIYIYVYIYVCVCVCVCIGWTRCIYSHTHIYIYMSRVQGHWDAACAIPETLGLTQYIYTRLFIYIYIYICMYIYICTYMYIYMCVCTYTYIYMDIDTYIWNDIETNIDTQIQVSDWVNNAHRAVLPLERAVDDGQLAHLLLLLADGVLRVGVEHRGHHRLPLLDRGLVRTLDQHVQRLVVLNNTGGGQGVSGLNLEGLVLVGQRRWPRPVPRSARAVPHRPEQYRWGTGREWA